MREYELEILNQYDIEIISTRKVRGAFFCETNEGLMLLKEAGISDGRALLLYQLLRQLSGSGYENVDLPIFTKEQELISTSRDGTRYMLKHWFGGRECDVRREGDVLEAVRNLSLLHQKMRWEPDPEDDAADPATGEALCEDGTQAAENVKMPPAGRHLKEEFLCHTRELKKVRAFIRKRRNKGKFEALFVQHFEKMIRLATRAAEQLETSGYETLYEQSICGKRLVHGDYNYHNVLMPAGVHGTSDGWGCRERVATTGFEHFRMDVQVLDLYYFLRKVMEKHHWDVKFGDAMLEMMIISTSTRSGMTWAIKDCLNALTVSLFSFLPAMIYSLLYIKRIVFSLVISSGSSMPEILPSRMTRSLLEIPIASSISEEMTITAVPLFASSWISS